MLTSHLVTTCHCIVIAIDPLLAGTGSGEQAKGGKESMLKRSRLGDPKLASKALSEDLPDGV